MKRFRYPLEVGGSQKDYMVIQSFDYEARGNAAAGESTNLNEGAILLATYLSSYQYQIYQT